MKWININGDIVRSTSPTTWKLTKYYRSGDIEYIYSDEANLLLENIRILGFINQDCINFNLCRVLLKDEGFKQIK